MFVNMPALRRGFVVSHPELGIYLGEGLGLGFWTKLDPVGQDSAVVFDTEADAANFIARHVEQCRHERTADFIVTEVAIDYGREWASMAELVLAGLEAWNPMGCEDEPEAPNE